jgi:hypothetical protein
MVVTPLKKIVGGFGLLSGAVDCGASDDSSV